MNHSKTIAFSAFALLLTAGQAAAQSVDADVNASASANASGVVPAVTVPALPAMPGEAELNTVASTLSAGDPTGLVSQVTTAAGGAPVAGVDPGNVDAVTGLVGTLTGPTGDAEANAAFTAEGEGALPDTAAVPMPAVPGTPELAQVTDLASSLASTGAISELSGSLGGSLASDLTGGLTADIAGSIASDLAGDIAGDIGSSLSSDIAGQAGSALGGVTGLLNVGGI